MTLVVKYYNHKKFVVRGDREIHDDFMTSSSVNGYWSTRLKDGAGWVIPVENKSIVEAYITKLSEKSDYDVVDIKDKDTQSRYHRAVSDEEPDEDIEDGETEDGDEDIEDVEDDIEDGETEDEEVEDAEDIEDVSEEDCPDFEEKYDERDADYYKSKKYNEQYRYDEKYNEKYDEPDAKQDYRTPIRTPIRTPTQKRREPPRLARHTRPRQSNVYETAPRGRRLYYDSDVSSDEEERQYRRYKKQMLLRMLKSPSPPRRRYQPERHTTTRDATRPSGASGARRHSRPDDRDTHVSDGRSSRHDVRSSRPDRPDRYGDQTRTSGARRHSRPDDRDTHISDGRPDRYGDQTRPSGSSGASRHARPRY